MVSPAMTQRKELICPKSHSDQKGSRSSSHLQTMWLTGQGYRLPLDNEPPKRWIVISVLLHPGPQHNTCLLDTCGKSLIEVLSRSAWVAQLVKQLYSAQVMKFCLLEDEECPYFTC